MKREPRELIILRDVVDVPSKLDPLLEGASGHRGDAEEELGPLNVIRRLDVEGAEHPVEDRNVRQSEHRMHHSYEDEEEEEKDRSQEADETC